MFEKLMFETLNVQREGLPAVGYDPVFITDYMGDYIDIKAAFDIAGNRSKQFLMAWIDCRRVVTTIDGVHPDQDVSRNAEPSSDHEGGDQSSKNRSHRAPGATCSRNT